MLPVPSRWSSTRLKATLGLVVFVTGAVVTPLLHQWDHAGAHQHGSGALVFDVREAHADLGPNGGLLLKQKPLPSKRAQRERADHARGSLEHFGVAVALAGQAMPELERLLSPPRSPAFVPAAESDDYLLSPLQPGAPPA